MEFHEQQGGVCHDKKEGSLASSLLVESGYQL